MSALLRQSIVPDESTGLPIGVQCRFNIAIGQACGVESYSPFLRRRERYNIPVPTARACLISFTDSEGIRHAVEVSASTLYETAALAIGEFRRCRFTANAHGAF